MIAFLDAGIHFLNQMLVLTSLRLRFLVSTWTLGVEELLDANLLELLVKFESGFLFFVLHCKGSLFNYTSKINLENKCKVSPNTGSAQSGSSFTTSSPQQLRKWS